MGVGLADDVTLHLHVLHDEVSAVERVSHDASDKGSSQHYGIGVLLVEEAAHGLLVGQVQLLVGSANEVGVAPLKQVVPNGTSYKALMAGNVYLCFLVKHDLKSQFSNLFHDSFLQILCQVGTNLGGSTFRSHLGNVMLHHQLYQFLK